MPDGWSLEAADFINKALQRKPANRLGFEHGTDELKSHPWFKNFNWNRLAAHKTRSPYVPDITVDNFD